MAFTTLGQLNQADKTTAVEWADRVRTGGFSVAGIALTIAAVAFVCLVVKGYLWYRKGKKVYKKIKKARA